MMKISELMDGLRPEAYELDDPHITSPDRILALAAERGGMPAAPARQRRPRRVLRTVLLAAVFAAALSVTAYAAYMARARDYVLPEDTATAAPTAAAETAGNRSVLSLTGYQGTPEYEAYAQWRAWLEENPTDLGALGLEQDYCEVEENYLLYGCYLADQAKALDRIAAEHGLALHTQRGNYTDGETLYDALGTEPFYGGVIDGQVTGYIYEDGSFKTDGMAQFDGGRAVGFQSFTNAKGSFAMISGSIDLSKDPQEWTYTTESGVPVDILLTADKAVILAETDGAYIGISVLSGSAPAYVQEESPQTSEEQKQFYLEGYLQGHPDADQAELEEAWDQFVFDWERTQEQMLPPAVTREDLENLADSVDFAVLADRFDGRAHPGTAEKVTALHEADLAAAGLPAAEPQSADQDPGEPPVTDRLTDGPVLPTPPPAA